MQPQRNPGRRVAVALCLAAMLAILAVQAVWGLQLLDDGYYYLQIAWNIARGAGSSFDGIHSTNGYHPLWQMTLVPLHWLASRKIVAWMAVGLQALLFACGGLVLHRLALRSGASGLTALAACAVWVINPWLWGKGAMSGMETGLLLLLFGLALHRLLLTLRRGDAGWRLGWLLALAAAARLDSAALALSCALALAASGRKRTALEALAPTVCYLALYLPLNLLAFGGATPVSGYIKTAAGRQLLARLLNDGDTALFGRAAGNLKELVTLGGRLPPALSALAIAALTLLIIRVHRRSGPSLRALMVAVLGYGGFLALFYSLMYSSLLGAYTYYWLPLLYGLVAVAFAAAGKLSRGHRRLLVGCALGLLAVFDVVYSADRLRSWSFTVPPEERPDAAGVRYLNSLEGDVLVGSWDAGYVGYNCRHPVVNLDGLVAGYDYQRYLEENGVDRWILREGITHLANVDYYAGKRQMIERRLGWKLAFADSAAMARPMSLFSLSPRDLDYASRELRVFYVYAREGSNPVREGHAGL